MISPDVLDRLLRLGHDVGMATWPEYRQVRPEWAEFGSALVYQHGVGLAFLATVGADGRPRLHPICPLLADGGLFAFIIPSPKQADLRRDGKYALHSFPCPDNEDAFYIAGQARLIRNPNRRDALATQFVAERSPESRFRHPRPMTRSSNSTSTHVC